MAEGFSVAASAIGITTLAIKSVQFLLNTIDNIKNVPDAVSNIKSDLQAVEPVLRHLGTALQGDNSHIVLTDEIKCAVENCARACTAFQELLNHWMRHSREGKTSWMDRWRVSLFGQQKIKTFKGQLSDCKSTLNMALSTASMYVYHPIQSKVPHFCQCTKLTRIYSLTITRQEYLMQETKDMMPRQNEAALVRDIARTDSERSAIESILQQPLVSGSIQQDDESEQSRQELLQEIQYQQSSNDTFRRMCDESLSRTLIERTGQNIRGVKATNSSAALAGFVNTSGEESQIDQDISDVTADNSSIAVAGVIKNVNFQDLRLTAPINITGYKRR